MNRGVYYLPIVALLLVGCGKKIRHNSGMFWDNFSTSNEEYNADVFSGSNNSIQYNASTAQVKNNQQEPAFNYQMNSQQYNVSHNDAQITQAVNGGYNAQQSSLAKQEGQIDLMQNSSYSNKQNNNYGIQQYSCGRCNNNVEQDNNKMQEMGRNMSIEVKRDVVKPADVAPKSYKVQAGYYVSERSANEVATQLRNAGINDVSVITENGGSKIYVGSFEDRASCNNILNRVRKVCGDAFVVFK